MFHLGTIQSALMKIATKNEAIWSQNALMKILNLRNVKKKKGNKN